MIVYMTDGRNWNEATSIEFDKTGFRAGFISDD